MPKSQPDLRLARYLPPFVASAVCLAFVGYFSWTVVHQTGMFVYPLDDTYIHLSVAHNLAAHHVWGISAAAFSSASSSPAWTVLLAAIEAVFGLHLLTPLVVNLLLAFWLLMIADSAVRRYAPAAPVWARCGILLVLVMATPLPSLVMIGMEHVAQTLSVLVLVLTAIEILLVAPSESIPRGRVVRLCLAAALAGAFRYETVFAIAPIGFLLLARRRWLPAVLVGLCSAIGPVAFGVYSHRISGFWLPFSVISKTAWDGGLADSWTRGKWELTQPLLGRPIELILVPTWLALCWMKGFWGRRQLLVLLTIVISATHIMLAPVNWFMRYESYFIFLYLLSLSVVAAAAIWPLDELRAWFRIGDPIAQNLKVLAATGFAAALLLPILHVRVMQGIKNPGRAAVDRYNQHLMMARFIRANYDHDTIVLNDIGAVAFYTDAKILDVFGLGSEEPLLAVRAGKRFTADDVAQWANLQNASIAIMSTSWSKPLALTPKDWIVARRWHLSRNIEFEDHDLSVYALKPSALPRLCAGLRAFQLPRADSARGGACDAMTADAMGVR